MNRVSLGLFDFAATGSADDERAAFLRDEVYADDDTHDVPKRPGLRARLFQLVRWRRPRAAPGNRTVPFDAAARARLRFAPNVVRNQKYSVVTFLPYVLYEQFKFFFNLYFLLVALSQFVPALKIGFLATYIAPLSFVLCVTIGKEAVDDYARHQRDAEANSAPYAVLVPAPGGGTAVDVVPASRLRVGDLVLLHKNQRVPADLVLLKTYAADAADDAADEPGHDDDHRHRDRPPIGVQQIHREHRRGDGRDDIQHGLDQHERVDVVRAVVHHPQKRLGARGVVFDHALDAGARDRGQRRFDRAKQAGQQQRGDGDGRVDEGQRH